MKRARDVVALCVGACVLAGPFSVPAAHAADPAQTMFVVDGSGSMWGRFEPDKRAKIDIVRDLLRPKIEADGQTLIGLSSFGHRRRGDCSDVEVIAAPGTDRGALLEPLAKLNPRGKGPLVAGLRAAISGLTPARPASLIVIGDDADNCQQDACAAAEDLAKTAPGVAIHMIAVGVDPADHPRLACVAKATGGTFHDARDSVGLALAVDAATSAALKIPGTPPSAGPTPALEKAAPIAPTDAGLQASVALAAGGEALNVPVRWRVYQAGNTEALAESDGATITARVTPGSYDVEADTGTFRARQTVSVEAGKGSNVVVPLNAARLTIVPQTGKQHATTQPVVTIEPVIDGKATPQAGLIGRRGGLIHILPAGQYNVTVADGNTRQQKSVTLAAGAVSTLDVPLGTGRVELSAGLRDDGGAIEDVTFAISEDDPDSPDGRRQVARSRAPTPQFVLPAGTYYVSARAGDGEVRERIAVGASDIVKRALILPLVPVKVSSEIGGQQAGATHGIVYRVTALDGDRREITRSVRPDLSLNLLPGRYRIAAHLDAHHLKVAQEIAVEAGKAVSVILKFDAAQVSLKTTLGTATDAAWEIVDANGASVWHTIAQDATAWLAPGRYTVHLDVRDKRTAAAFEVKAGERKTVQIGSN